MDLEFKLSIQINKIILKIADDEHYEELYENRIRELICEVELNFQKAKKVMKYVCKYEADEYNDGRKLFYKFM